MFYAILRTEYSITVAPILMRFGFYLNKTALFPTKLVTI